MSEKKRSLADEIEESADNYDDEAYHALRFVAREARALEAEAATLRAERDELRREVNAAFESMDPIAPCQINLAARVRQIVDERDELRESANDLLAEVNKHPIQAKLSDTNILWYARRLREALGSGGATTVEGSRPDEAQGRASGSSPDTPGATTPDATTLGKTIDLMAALKESLKAHTPAPSGAKESDDDGEV